VAPAFSSPRQAGAFALLVSVALLLPLLLGKWGLSPREETYAAFSWGSGAYPYLQDQIFHRKGDIDILFIGSSHINSAIDPQYVQHRLSEKLGRPATVISLCWGGAGFDPLYFAANDLLQRRKVRMLVFYDDQRTNAPSAQGWRWIRWGDNAGELNDLPLNFRLAYYYAAVVGMPRNLLDLVKPSLPINLSPRKKIELAQDEFHPPSEWLGLAPEIVTTEEKAVVSKTISAAEGAQPSDVLVFPDKTREKFDFSGPPPASLQIYFSKKLISLAKTHGTKLVCLNIPVLADEGRAAISEGPLWPDVLNADSALVGISPDKFFAGMDESTVEGLFRNPTHMSQEGQDYFTRLLTPTLIELYDQP
jgi:hypothetical protein